MHLQTLVDLLFFFFTSLHGLWDLSFLTRNGTQVPAVKVPSPKHWTTWELPPVAYFSVILFSMHRRELVTDQVNLV